MAQPTPIKKDHKLDDYNIATNCNSSFNAALPEWLKSARLNAYTDVQQSGLPTPKWERFKYTNVAQSIKNKNLSYAPADISTERDLNFVTDLTSNLNALPDWAKSFLSSAPAGQEKYQDMALWDINSALFENGLIVNILAHSDQDKPLNLTIKGRNGCHTQPRFLINAGENSHFTINETHEGEGDFWHNGVTQIHVGKNATLRHYRFQSNPDNAVHTQNTAVTIEEGGTYECFTMTMGSGLSRNQIHVSIIGSHAECILNGINLLKHEQIGDTTITIEHKAPNCTSHQNYRSVLNDQSNGIFQGKVHVHQIAQKTDGYQKSDTLLLSDTAQMNTKPELEIYADDVKCSHGTTTGKLEDTPLFYLRSRGIPEDEARALLIQSFLGDITERISDEHIREMAINQVISWLKA